MSCEFKDFHTAAAAEGESSTNSPVFKVTCRARCFRAAFEIFNAPDNKMHLPSEWLQIGPVNQPGTVF